MRGAVFADFTTAATPTSFFFATMAPPCFTRIRARTSSCLRRETGAALAKAVVLDAQVADFNHDGYFDLAVWSTDGYQVLLNQRDGKFAPAPAPAIPAPAGLFAFRGVVADLNGDSFPDLLVADAHGKLHFLVNHEGRFREGSIALPVRDPTALSLADPTGLENPGQLDLLAMTRSGQLQRFREGGPARALGGSKDERLQEQQRRNRQRGGIQGRQLLQQGGCHQQPGAGFYRRSGQARCHPRHLAECRGAELDRRRDRQAD